MRDESLDMYSQTADRLITTSVQLNFSKMMALGETAATARTDLCLPRTYKTCL